MGIFDLLKNNVRSSGVSSEEDAVFEHILRVFFAFKDKYDKRVVSIEIYPSNKLNGYVAFDITFDFDGKVKLQKSNETDELLEYFEVVSEDSSFQTLECVYNTFEQSNNRAYVEKKLKSYVKHFMLENPSRKFDLSQTGARIKYW